ncbi:partitioning defective 3 homolog isoform X2 [Eupeodes corollae]|uniref:partitioning defective 3 homolog isoform X2 n=1 Tax=Eupeodes corollae TaxID=290404 RepID=UPI0024915434|nr:partitioning defective 3 homolog isoform X2 [Eupeodes corollae]
MKVTVCFGSVRIVVPCGSGDLLVKDLIHEATRRYKKAVGKEPDSWVAVHHLQTQSGILDPDDCLRDVADDREQILASFEDSGPDPGVPQGGGDGASGSSSVGTGSPDIFRDPTNTDATTGSHANASVPHIEVTSTTACPMNGLGLQVRRSSDPNLLASLKNQTEATKRWSAAAPACRDDSPERIMDKVVYLSPQWEEDDDVIHHAAQPQQNFARSGRLSMQFLGDGNGYKWMEAAEKLQTQSYSTKSLPRETGKRKEPLGQAYESIREKDGEMLLIINEYGGPLGLTAMPDSENGGLVVQHVELGSRAERGRLRRGDRILEINGTKLVGLSEGKVQDHLRRSLESSELRVRVIRGDKLGKPSRRDSKVAEMIEAEEKASSAGTKVATVSPTRKSHTAPVGTSFQTANTRKLGRKIEIILKKGPHGLGFSVTTRDNPAGGHCPIYIKNVLPRGAAIEDGRLKPGDRLLEVDGLPMTGKTQTDVVSILRSTQPGASVRIIVSRQQELVEVDEREINFSEENELATGTPPKPPAPVLPSGHDVKKSSSSRSLFEQHQLQQQANLNESQHFIDGGSESAASSESLQAGIAWRSREVLTFHIPVHDTEKAGLGVSVKGKTTSSNSSSGSNGSMKHDGDLGIFVKNVIHGGAASRDGRLRMNDQLLSVNGVSLLGQSNAEAMETLRRAMVNTPGKHPGVITLSVARKITRSHSSGDILESSSTNDSSNTSENSGATVIYLSPDKKDNRDMNRWSNPVLDRLTGGVCSSNSNQNRRLPPPLSNTVPHGLRNESYYMATNDTWSPSIQSPQMHGTHVNNSVLIEDDPEPMSPMLPNRPNDSVSTLQSTISNGVNFDATYSSQLSLETNNSGAEHFSRDAVGRRSISEKHHAALDARETGTYQRNKKLREDRERERRLQLTKSAVFGGSAESISTRIANANHQMANGKKPQPNDLRSEAMDQLGELGPSLGLKKSSSLESLQTMVQEIQMSDEPRGPSALRAPRGRGREDSLRAAVVGEHDTNKARKHWLLEEADSDGGFPNRNGPFQSSLNDGKNKSRAKKPSLLRGIGHMFRFGKNRKDTVAPMEPQNDYTMSVNNNQLPPQLPPPNGTIPTAALSIDRGGKIAPPIYQPPPPPPSASSGQSSTSSKSSSSTAIHQNDIFNHRYQHYANYEDLQQHQLSDEPSQDVLSESTLECMRQQVIRQRNKVEAESRRHQHYHSQRSTRSPEANLHQSHIGGPGSRPASSYYEYETVQHNVSRSHSNSQKQQNTINNIPSIAEHQQQQQHHQQQQQQRHWKSATLNGFNPATLNSSGRSRGPFVTQVTIRDQSHLNNASSINAGTQQPTYQQVHKLSSSLSSSSSHQQSAQPHASKV